MSVVLKENIAALDFRSDFRSIGDVSDDELLNNMKENGKRLGKLLGISKSDIDIALKESREKWK